MSNRQFAITTDDNRYDPIREFDAWYNFDQFYKGYRTCDRLASLVHTSDELSDDLNDLEIESVMDEMCKRDFAVDREGNIHKYIKVVAE